MEDRRQTVSLVLGSGGARGLAHIGIIDWLESHGYAIESISGCSMGALIGGIYACGELDTFTEWVRAIDKLAIVRLLDVSWGKAGLVEGEKIITTLAELVGDRRIEDLSIRFTAVAVDINREKEVWITSGSVFDAIRASISMPLFFTPIQRQGMTLMDGGILNPVPIAPTFKDDTDLTIAVNLGGPAVVSTKAVANEQPPRRDAPKNNFVAAVQARIGEFIDELAKKKPPGSSDWAMLDVANQTFDTMQRAIARQKLAAYPPDRTIVIPKNACRTLEFDRAEEMIALGRAAAAAQMSPPGTDRSV